MLDLTAVLRREIGTISADPSRKVHVKLEEDAYGAEFRTSGLAFYCNE
jgi:hypothetical protein